MSRGARCGGARCEEDSQWSVVAKTKRVRIFHYLFAWVGQLLFDIETDNDSEYVLQL